MVSKGIARVLVEVTKDMDKFAPGEVYNLTIVVWADGQQFTRRELVPKNILVSEFDFVVGCALRQLKASILSEQEKTDGQGR